MRPRIVLAGLSKRLKGLHWESDTVLRIGRHESSDIVLDDSSIGKHQAEVALHRGKWVVRDLVGCASQPTLVNGRAVGGDNRLLAKDVLQCGNLALEVVLVEEPPVEQPKTPPPANSEGGGQEGSPPKSSRILLRVEAATQNTWDEALQLTSLSPAKQGGRHSHIFTLMRTGYHLCHIGSLDELLHCVLSDTVNALKAQRGSILLWDARQGELRMRTFYAPKLNRSLHCQYSRTMAERSFRKGESLLCTDVNAETELSAAASVRAGTMSSLMSAVLRSPRKRLGVLQVDRGPAQMPFDQDDFTLIDAIGASVAIGIESAQLIEEQREQFAQTVASLSLAVEVRDYGTGNHTRRVTDYALLLADELKLPQSERYQIQIGTPLHDIGKIGIDDAILRKAGRLTHDEFEQMKLHTVKGAAILQSLNALHSMIPIVRHHHERWDGSGYPDGLAGDNISQTARIVAVADAFDAMTSDRPYRKALSLEHAFMELEAKAGAHFDPACAAAFLRLRPAVEQLVAAKSNTASLFS